MTEKLNEHNAINVLDKIYELAVNGKGPICPVEDLAKDYLLGLDPQRIAASNDCELSDAIKRAIKSMQNKQIAKCTASGFITGFGGLITLPVTIPANISSVLYVQMRMIACTAYMAGYDIHSDQVKTLIYCCLVGLSTSNIVKHVGIKFATKCAQAGIKKIPGKVIIKINQKVGFRFITKFGSKGLVNLGKMIPVVGAIVSGGFDFAETKVIANRAYTNFVNGDFSQGERLDDSDIFDAEFEEE
ncbi:MAG: EcsC family protein [Proteobacteria bacterium]|nr:EcsC family protein [Pseudomonadota bacterium]